jgi:predicted aspartyl protease
MKNIGPWIIVAVAFAMGFLASEYRHQQSSVELTGTPISTTTPKTSSQNTPTPNNSSISNTPPQIENTFSWEDIRQLINHQDYDKAILLLKTYLQDYQDDAQAWYLLANTYQAQHKPLLALEAWLNYFNHEQDANNITRALAQLKQYLQQVVNSPTLSKETAEQLLEPLNNLLDISINDSQLHLMLANLHLNTGDDYQAQYHALMAANTLETQQQAEKILAQLNGEITDENIELPLIRFGEQYLLTVLIEGNPARLLLDTGASISGVTSIYTRKYPSIIKNTRPIRLNTASGAKDSFLFTVDTLHMGSAHFAQHMLAVLPMDDITEFDGLLGIDILGKFDFVIDQNNATLKLSARNQ